MSVPYEVQFEVRPEARPVKMKGFEVIRVPRDRIEEVLTDSNTGKVVGRSVYYRNKDIPPDADASETTDDTPTS